MTISTTGSDENINVALNVVQRLKKVMIKVSKEDIKLFREEKNSCTFNQSQIQPCLNAYLITSIPPTPFFPDQSEREDLVKRRHMDVSLKY